MEREFRERIPKTLEEREAELKDKGKVSLRKLLATARDEETAKPIPKKWFHKWGRAIEKGVRQDRRPETSKQRTSDPIYGTTSNSRPAPQAADAAEQLPNSHSVAQTEDAAERLDNIFAIPPRTDTSRAWNFSNTKQTPPSIPEDRAITIPVEELPRHTGFFWGTGAASSSGPQLSRSKSGRPENLGTLSEIESDTEPAPRLMRSTGSRRPALGTDSDTGPSNEPSPAKPRSASKLGQWMQRLRSKNTPRTES